MIEAQNVRSFDQTPALPGGSVSVARGEILAVMGRSGSGKSTLLHCLAGILVPGSGEIRCAGHRIDKPIQAHFARLDFPGGTGAGTPDIDELSVSAP